ncbi:MAG: hypothetical protein IPM51_04190 [Sphingobacteriaceae bacterium]|nr:hypothetical protein [Sphingobacteriaceae bacterium]
MRIIDAIPHPSMTISIFSMNNKYIVKFEAGPMEQVFKFNSDDIGGVEQLKNKINDEFMDQTMLRFKEMFLLYKEL